MSNEANYSKGERLCTDDTYLGVIEFLQTSKQRETIAPYDPGCVPKLGDHYYITSVMAHTLNGNGAAGQQPVATGERADLGGFKLKFCTVCASNQNRFVHPAI